MLKAVIENKLVAYKGATIRLSEIFQQKLCRQERLVQNIKSDEKQVITTKYSLASKATIWNQKTDKELPILKKAKGVHHQTSITRNVKRTS